MLGSTGKAEAVSYKPVLTAEKQDTTTTLKRATRHQVNYLGFIRLNAETALAGLTRIAKNRGDLCAADFSSYKLLKTSVDSSSTHTRLQRTHDACSHSPPRSKYYSQEGAQLHSLEKSLFQIRISPGAQLYHAQSYKKQSL